jgi:hypothetical protein
MDTRHNFNAIEPCEGKKIREDFTAGFTLRELGEKYRRNPAQILEYLKFGMLWVGMTPHVAPIVASLTLTPPPSLAERVKALEDKLTDVVRELDRLDNNISHHRGGFYDPRDGYEDLVFGGRNKEKEEEDEEEEEEG